METCPPSRAISAWPDDLKGTWVMLVPATALLYSEHGTYVYCQLNSIGADDLHFAVVTVRPLARVGQAWLIDGLERTDRVVVQGSGVLWSLQGLGTFSAAEEEHD